VAARYSVVDMPRLSGMAGALAANLDWRRRLPVPNLGLASSRSRLECASGQLLSDASWVGGIRARAYGLFGDRCRENTNGSVRPLLPLSPASPHFAVENNKCYSGTWSPPPTTTLVAVHCKHGLIMPPSAQVPTVPDAKASCSLSANAAPRIRTETS
jgi:hypothetical protein